MCVMTTWLKSAGMALFLSTALVAFSAAQAGDLGSVAGVRGKLTAYSDASGQTEVSAPAKEELIGQRVVREENGYYAVDVGGTYYWVKKHRIRLDRKLAVPEGCQEVASSFVGNSATRGAGKGCAE